MDEDSLTDFLKEEFPFSGELGIGDDCSVERFGDEYLLVTNDILIEDVHFRLKYQTPGQLARKCLAVNISDILAMGGTPANFYLALGIPPEMEEKKIHRFFSGLSKACTDWSVELAGGDLSRSDKMVISVTMKGKTSRPVLRKDARPGDQICMSGPLGEAAVGFELLEREIAVSVHPEAGYYLDRFRDPEPDFTAGEIIARRASAMIDVSDGFVRDLSRVLRASGRGAVVNYDRFVIRDSMKEICRKYEMDLRHKILAGGEDYVLLFTLPPADFDLLSRELPGMYSVGEIVTGNRMEVFSGGNRIEIRETGFDHFHSS